MEYVRITCGLADKGRLVPKTDDIYKYVNDIKRDWYSSIFRYNQAHYDTFKKTGTIAGITDVTTNMLSWDFDKADDVEMARKDSLELCSRLLSYGVPEANLKICFSGGKGFSVEIETDQIFTPDEFKRINAKVAEGLSTNDDKICNASRVFRIPMTTHNKSGLFKFPLTLKQLSDTPVDVIQGMAKSLDNVAPSESFDWTPVSLSETIKNYAKAPLKVTSKAVVQDVHLDFTHKPKGLTNCKYAIMNGYFPGGSRNQALLALASTLKYQGYPKEVVHNMLKAAARYQAARTNTEPYSKEEIWFNIVNQVFSSTWKGGQYSCRNTPWLKDICDALGEHKCKTADADNIVTFGDITSDFKKYVNNIDQNTIKTGIQSLDEKIFLSTGCNVGIVGAPGSGKSSFALSMLESTSQLGVKSVFASLDMHRTRIYEKLLYRVSGGQYNRDSLYKLFKDGKYEDLVSQVNSRYKNVYFFDKTMPTVKDLKNYILECQEISGEKIKLVMVDYFERIFSDISEDTAASKRIAAELQDLVMDLDICLVTLLQPNKASGTVSEPIYSYGNIKGSSFLAQSFRIILSMYREGYDPRNPGNDRFITVNALKNDLGEISSTDFYWKPKTGDFHEIDQEGQKELNDLRANVKAEKEQQSDGTWA